MRLGLLFLAIAGCAVAPACSSGDFAVAPSTVKDGGGEDSSSDSPLVQDAGPDAPDPCAPVPGEARYCVHLTVESDHPGYDESSGAKSLGIDGQGIVYVNLYNTPPLDPVTNVRATPIATIRYPPSSDVGAEAAVATAFPLTLTGKAVPDTYYVDAEYQDNTSADRGATTQLAGDFILVPQVKDGALEYPQETLAVGTTKTFDVALRAVRRVDATVGVTPGLHAQALANAAIHGDGFVFFLLYDGDLSGGTSTATFVDESFNFNCIDLQPAGAAPILDVSFPIHVNGRHKVLAVLDDYPSTVKSKDFPRGSILSVTGSKVADKVPVIDPGTTSWVSSVDLRFASVPNPYTTSDAPADDALPYHCPGSTGK